MSPLSLLTVCIGLSCHITESNVSYIHVLNENHVSSLQTGVQSGVTRLKSSLEWFTTVTNQAVKMFRDMLELITNSALLQIQDYVQQNVTEEKKDIDKCYHIAVTNLTRALTSKFPHVQSCIKDFDRYIRVFSAKISNKLADADKLSKYLEAISECETEPDPQNCKVSRTNDVVQQVGILKRYAHHIAEKLRLKFENKFEKAVSCQARDILQLHNEADRINSRTITCINNS